MLSTMSPDISIVNSDNNDALSLCSLSDQADNLTQILERLTITDTEFIRHILVVGQIYTCISSKLRVCRHLLCFL